MKKTDIAVTTAGKSLALSGLSTQELKAELAKSLDITVRHLTHLAAIWHELELRGEDMSDLRHGLMAYLPMIARNKVDPRLIVNYAGQKTLLGALARLPIAKQAELADSGMVTVITLDQEGNKTEVQTPLSRLSASHVYQVFNDDSLRSANDQFKLLALREKAVAKPKTHRLARRVKIDHQAKVLMVSNTAADIGRVLKQLSEYFDVDIEMLIREHKAGAASK